jgi:phage N-6-adenine-methyltransferase
MASQQQASNTPLSKRDSWQTPQWLFDWANNRWGFDVDLAADDSNKKLPRFFDIDDDALMQHWWRCGESFWVNPPYSEIEPWLEKAWLECQKGNITVVLLIPTFNGDKYWGKHIFGKAAEVINIVGRVAFELPDENGEPKPQSGNTRGSCLIVFNRSYETGTLMSWVNRDDMKEEYSNG